MKLNELLENVEVLNILGDTEVEITGVNIDSRKIEKGQFLVLKPMVTSSYQRPLSREQLLFSANTSPTNGNQVLHTSPLSQRKTMLER